MRDIKIGSKIFIVGTRCKCKLDRHNEKVKCVVVFVCFGS